jgi:hypothetical protein
MIPFEESDTCKEIKEYYTALKGRDVKIRETELPAL